jgi:hypothetical protein
MHICFILSPQVGNNKLIDIMLHGQRNIKRITSVNNVPTKNGLKQGDALLSLLFNFALIYTVRNVQANHKLLKFNGTHQVIIYADVNLQGHSIHIISFISPLKGDWTRRKC